MTHSYRSGRIAAVAAASLAPVLLTSCSSSSTHGATTPAAAVVSTSSQATPVAVTGTPPGAASPASAGKGATACTLITEKDVTSVLGGDPGAGGGDVRAKGSTCAYSGTLPLSVNLVLVPANGKVAYDGAKTSDPGSGDTVVDVPALGDAAFGIFSPSHAIVEFSKGDAYVSVLVSSTTGDLATIPKDQALALATIAAARL